MQRIVPNLICYYSFDYIIEWEQASITCHEVPSFHNVQTSQHNVIYDKDIIQNIRTMINIIFATLHK